MIAATNPEKLAKCLESIRNQEEHDIEVIVNNATESQEITMICSTYGYAEIKKKTSILWSRYITVAASTGDHILLFDDTRSMSNGLISKLREFKDEIICIDELAVGTGLYTRLYNHDLQSQRKIEEQHLNPIEIRYVLPRFYPARLLKDSLNAVLTKLGEELFTTINAMDLELIYYEAFQISKRVKFLAEPKIIHQSDEGIIDVFKKFYKYGRNTKKISGTVYHTISDLRGRRRKYLGTMEKLYGILFILLRGTPFVLGYLL